MRDLNAAIDSGDAEATFACLQASQLSIQDLDESGVYQYQQTLSAAKTLLARDVCALSSALLSHTIAAVPRRSAA
jgi:hypothetical protein